MSWVPTHVLPTESWEESIFQKSGAGWSLGTGMAQPPAELLLTFPPLLLQGHDPLVRNDYCRDL